MKSLYESAFSYITKQIDKRIDEIEKEKDSAVESLEAQKKAAEEAYQVQIDAIENQIESLDDLIEKKQEEIDAINDAADARQREIDLQKAQYELERMQNQKTSLVYRDGQMVYETDTSGIRDKREEVENAKREIQIANIEDEIKGLEKQKDILNNQKELLEEALDKSNEYFDNLIKQTENQYDTMIQGLEDYKEQFTELTDLMENAQMEASLQELGINIEALLGGSQEEFEKLKTSYVGILSDMSRGNDDVLNQLSRLSEISAYNASYLNETKDAFDGLGQVTLGSLPSDTEELSSATSNLATSASEASTSVGSIGESASTVSQNVGTVKTNVDELKDTVNKLSESFMNLEFPEVGEEGYVEKLNALATAFRNIQAECAKLSQLDFSSIIGTAGGSGEDANNVLQSQSTNIASGSGFIGLASAISDAVSIIWLKMNTLKTALQTGNEAFQSQADKIQNEYIPTWEELQTRLSEIIGVGGGNNASVSAQQGDKKGDVGNTGSIIDTLQTGGDEVNATLQDPWLKSFEDFAEGDNSIKSICDTIIKTVSKMASSIQEQCSLAANSLIELANSTFAISFDGNFGATTGNTNSNTTSGKAYATGTGYKGLQKTEKNALRSEYGQPELTVYPNGETELTTSPTMSDLPKGTVVYNEEQTRQIMNNSSATKFSNALAQGTVTAEEFFANTRPLQPSDKMYDVIQKFDQYYDKICDVIKPIAYNVNKMVEQSAEGITKYENTNNNYKQGVTLNIGDIHLHEVQNVDTFADEICNRFPSLMLQKMHSIY